MAAQQQSPDSLLQVISGVVSEAVTRARRVLSGAEAVPVPVPSSTDSMYVSIDKMLIN